MMSDRAPTLPTVTDRASCQVELDRLRIREKAHTRVGDAIAAARRCLPMVEVATDLELTGADGPVTLLEACEGRRQLMDLTAYGRQELWEDSPPELSGRPGGVDEAGAGADRDCQCRYLAWRP